MRRRRSFSDHVKDGVDNGSFFLPRSCFHVVLNLLVHKGSEPPIALCTTRRKKTKEQNWVRPRERRMTTVSTSSHNKGCCTDLRLLTMIEEVFSSLTDYIRIVGNKVHWEHDHWMIKLLGRRRVVKHLHRHD
jgi:hypothetical protein